jgi:hypothetical protein
MFTASNTDYNGFLCITTYKGGAMICCLCHAEDYFVEDEGGDLICLGCGGVNTGDWDDDEEEYPREDDDDWA